MGRRASAFLALALTAFASWADDGPPEPRDFKLLGFEKGAMYGQIEGKTLRLAETAKEMKDATPVEAEKKVTVL